MGDGVDPADVAEELVAEPLARRTSPAMSTNSSWVATILADLPSQAQVSSRSSGTATRPTLGSMVQKG